jgi:hypothetical protein
MDTLVVEIAKAFVEQTQDLDQITKAMTEESASVAHALSTQSVQRGTAVQQLNVFTGAGAGRRHESVSTSRHPVAT